MTGSSAAKPGRTAVYLKIFSNEPSVSRIGFEEVLREVAPRIIF